MDKLEQAELQSEKRWDRLRAVIIWFEFRRLELPVVIDRVSIRAPRVEGDDWFVTIAGFRDDGEPVVAFNSAETLERVLVVTFNRVENQQLKWRHDEYRK